MVEIRGRDMHIRRAEVSGDQWCKELRRRGLAIAHES